MSTELDKLLSTSIESIQDVEERIKKYKRSHEQVRLSDPNSQYEVSVAGTVVEVTSDFEEAMKAYDISIRNDSIEIHITHILNGARTVVLQSAIVKHRDRPWNSLKELRRIK